MMDATGKYRSWQGIDGWYVLDPHGQVEDKCDDEAHAHATARQLNMALRARAEVREVARIATDHRHEGGEG